MSLQRMMTKLPPKYILPLLSFFALISYISWTKVFKHSQDSEEILVSSWLSRFAMTEDQTDITSTMSTGIQGQITRTRHRSKMSCCDGFRKVNKSHVQTYSIGQLKCSTPQIYSKNEYYKTYNATIKIFEDVKKTRTFLPEYKNPCWEVPYDGRPLYQGSHAYRGRFSSCFNKAEANWKRKHTEGSGTRLRCAPYAYLAGMPKCGTTDLYQALIMHENITEGCVKEPEWWARKALGYTTQKPVPFPEYTDLWDLPSSVISDKRHMITLDGSPSTLWEYARWPLYPGNEDYMEPVITPPQLIYNLTPSAKIIIILRNPTDRLYSHYLHQSRLMRWPANPSDFHAKSQRAVTKFEDCASSRTERECAFDACLLNNTKGTPTSQQITLTAGLYFTYINDLLKVFPRDQVKIITLEKYQQDRMVIQDILTFLQIGVVSKAMERKLNSKKVSNQKSGVSSKQTMLRETRLLLDHFYLPHNTKLSNLLGDQQYLWAS